MPIHPSEHAGGEAFGDTVDDTGNNIIQPAYPGGRLKYRIIIADKANTDVVFIRLHPTEPAVFGKGIPLWPGDFHEITYENAYQGNIRAISAPGTTQTLYGHDGR